MEKWQIRAETRDKKWRARRGRRSITLMVHHRPVRIRQAGTESVVAVQDRELARLAISGRRQRDVRKRGTRRRKGRASVAN